MATYVKCLSRMDSSDRLEVGKVYEVRDSIQQVTERLGLDIYTIRVSDSMSSQYPKRLFEEVPEKF